MKTVRLNLEHLETRLVPALITDRTVAAFDIANSRELVERTVAGQVFRYTGLTATPAQTAEAADRIASGTLEEEIEAELIASPEFAAGSNGNRDPNLTNEAYVDELYTELFGREADPAGRAHWIGEMDAGMDRERVALNFLHSPEGYDDYLRELYRASYAPFASIYGPDMGQLLEHRDDRAGAAERRDTRAKLYSGKLFYQLYGDTEEGTEENLRKWIERGLYERVLGRPATEAEVNAHLFTEE